ncbi:MAG TPA: FecR family protein [Pyrinomonadaceae bacterium]
MLSGFAFAQDDKIVSAAASTYVISAKAGGVNYMEGKVSIVRKNGKSGLLLNSDQVEVGDKVSTGADGKAEILLNPGSFVRLGSNAEFEFQSTDLDNLKLRLSAGSAIFEVYADTEFKVSLDLPDADIVLTKSGVYRVDVLADGSGKLSVWRGKVVFGDDETELKAGKTAIIKGKAAAGVAKFDRDNKDEFDIWSDLRAKEATKINKRLQRNALTSSLLSSYNSGGWNMFGTFGLWVFDSFTRRWCFLPFGSGWSSPYGYGYGFNIYHCPLPPRVYYSPAPPVTPQQPQQPSEAHTRNRIPSFQRFENNQGIGNSGVTRGSTASQNDNGGGWNPTVRSRDDSRSNGTSFPTSTPSETRSAPAQPSFPTVPSRTETKENRRID